MNPEPFLCPPAPHILEMLGLPLQVQARPAKTAAVVDEVREFVVVQPQEILLGRVLRDKGVDLKVVKRVLALTLSMLAEEGRLTDLLKPELPAHPECSTVIPSGYRLVLLVEVVALEIVVPERRFIGFPRGKYPNEQPTAIPEELKNEVQSQHEENEEGDVLYCHCIYVIVICQLRCVY